MKKILRKKNKTHLKSTANTLFNVFSFADFETANYKDNATQLAYLII